MRREATDLFSTYGSILEPAAEFAGHDASDARVMLITTMLLGLAAGATSESREDARQALYAEATDDLPAWTIAAAVRMWVRRECPASLEKAPNYSFPPSPGTLRGMAMLARQPYRDAQLRLSNLLVAESLEEAMDPKRTPPKPPAIAGSKPKIAIAARRM